FPMPSAIPRITRSLALVVVIDGADAGLVVPACLVVWSIASDTPLNSVRVIHMPPAVAAVIVTGVEEVRVATSTAPYQISMCVFVVDDWALNQLPTPPPLTPDRDPAEVPPTMISTLPAVEVGAAAKGTGSEGAEVGTAPAGAKLVAVGHRLTGRPSGAVASAAVSCRMRGWRNAAFAFLSGSARVLDLASRASLYVAAGTLRRQALKAAITRTWD